MKKRYKFVKKGHHHSLDDKPLYGTTTALAVIAKPFLIPWASKMAVEHIRSNWKIGKAYTKQEREEILTFAQKAHSYKKQAGADTGKLLHTAVEKYIKKGKLYTGKEKEVQVMFNNFLKWEKKEKPKFLMSEKQIFSEKMWLGGIVDFVCEIKGKRYIGDIKTSNGIYPEHFLQMGAYDLCLEEMGQKPADGFIILNLQKSGRVNIKKMKDNQKHRQGFIHALELFKILRTMKWNPYY